jgi:Trk K+ transport system NAD-binding subunit
VQSIRGDALDPGVLRDAGVADARIITSTVRRPQDNRLLLETVRDVPVLVRVFEDDEATWVQSMGGRPVVSADVAAKAFFRWYDERPVG